MEKYYVVSQPRGKPAVLEATRTDKRAADDDVSILGWLGTKAWVQETPELPEFVDTEVSDDDADN